MFFSLISNPCAICLQKKSLTLKTSAALQKLMQSTVLSNHVFLFLTISLKTVKALLSLVNIEDKGFHSGKCPTFNVTVWYLPPCDSL